MNRLAMDDEFFVNYGSEPVEETSGNRRIANVLDDVKETQLRQADREIWASNGLDIALSNVERLQQSLIRVAEMCHDGGRSAQRLSQQYLDGLERFLETLVTTKTALRLDFTRIEIDGVSLSRMETSLTSLLDSLAESLTREDYTSLADSLEYELLTNLSAWNRALRQLRLSSHSNA